MSVTFYINTFFEQKRKEREQINLLVVLSNAFRLIKLSLFKNITSFLIFLSFIDMQIAVFRIQSVTFLNVYAT